MVLKPERFMTWITPEFHVTPLEFHGILRNSRGIPRKFFQTVFHKRGPSHWAERAKNAKEVCVCVFHRFLRDPDVYK